MSVVESIPDDGDDDDINDGGEDDEGVDHGGEDGYGGSEIGVDGENWWAYAQYH